MVRCLISPKMVGVVLLSSLLISQDVAAPEYYKLVCIKWKASDFSDPCNYCAKSICVQYEKKKLTKEDIRYIQNWEKEKWRYLNEK